MRGILLTSFFLLTFSGFSQRDYLYGVIKGTDTQASVEGVHVSNTTSRLLTSSNAIGAFHIPVKVGDTLTFTHIGYESMQYVVKEEVSDDPLEFWLTSDTVHLQEVEVNILPEYWRFKQLIVDTQTLDSSHVVFGLGAIPIDAYEIAANEQNVTVPNYHAPTVGIGFDLGGLTKKGKEEKKLQKILAEQEIERAAYRKFNRDWISRETKLTNDELTDFIAFCNFTPKYLAETTLFEIRERMMALLEEFQTNQKTDRLDYNPGA